MMIRAIKTDADYEAALARVEEIFDSEPGSPEFDELEIWGTLIGAYENHPVSPPTQEMWDFLIVRPINIAGHQ